MSIKDRPGLDTLADCLLIFKSSLADQSTINYSNITIMGCILPLLSAGLLAFASITSSAHTGSAQTETSKKCIDLEISVPVKADQWRYDQPRIDSNIDAMDWTVNVTTHGAPNFTERHIGDKKHHIEEIFTISAKLCIPSRKSSKSNILQIASPGQAFDKRYA